MNNEKRMSAQEMIRYRQSLMKQKTFLTDVLSKIEKQILALQVERLHLRNTLCESQSSKQETLSDPMKENDEQSELQVTNENNSAMEKLDLVVPSQNSFEEETEDDELTENEQRVMNQLDFIMTNT